MRCYDCDKIVPILFPIHVVERLYEYDKYVCKDCFKRVLKEEKE